MYAERCCCCCSAQRGCARVGQPRVGGKRWESAACAAPAGCPKLPDFLSAAAHRRGATAQAAVVVQRPTPPCHPQSSIPPSPPPPHTHPTHPHTHSPHPPPTHPPTHPHHHHHHHTPTPTPTPTRARPPAHYVTAAAHHPWDNRSRLLFFRGAATGDRNLTDPDLSLDYPELLDVQVGAAAHDCF